MTDVSTCSLSSGQVRLFVWLVHYDMCGSSGHGWEFWSCVGVVVMCGGVVDMCGKGGCCGYVWELCIYVGKLGVVVSLLLSILSVA